MTQKDITLITDQSTSIAKIIQDDINIMNAHLDQCYRHLYFLD